MSSDTSPGVEVEIKLGLVNPEQRDALLAALPPSTHTLVQDNYYFDTSAGRLSRARIMLRIRYEAGAEQVTGRAVMAAKRRRSRTDAGRFEADEIEHIMEPETWRAVVTGSLNAAQLDNPVTRWVNAEVGPIENLEILGLVSNERIVVPAAGYIFEVDRTRFPDGSVDVEVEVETDDIDGARAAVEQYARKAGVALFEQTKGKHRRFRERLGR